MTPSSDIASCAVAELTNSRPAIKTRILVMDFVFITLLLFGPPFPKIIVERRTGESILGFAYLGAMFL